MRESGQNKRDYDVMMDNIGCYSPIDHTEDTETNVKRTKNINGNNIQTQVLSPPNSEPVSSCTVINSGSNSSGSHSHSINENEEEDKTEVNDTDDNKVDNNKIKEDDENVKSSIKKENIDNKDSKKEITNTNKKESSIKNKDAKITKSDAELTDIKKEDTVMPHEHVKICTQIIRNIKRHHDSGPFLKPVDPVALCIPDYFTIIHHPMDISTIESKLKSSSYKNIDEFIDDFSLMFQNCYEYNGTQQPVSLMAKNLELSFNNQLNHYYHEINNSSEESSQKDNLETNTKNNLSNDNTDDTNTTSIKSNGKTGGKTTVSKRKTYNNSFYSYLYKKSSSRLMKLTGEMVVCKDVINEILKKRYEHISYPFLHPVDPVALNIPDYPLIIKTPMDISTIQEKLDSGIYLKKKEFEDDFRLIFKNCFQYNPEGTDVYVLGKQLEEIFNEQWNYYNDRYEKSLQAKAEKLNNTNRTTHRKTSTTSHTNTPSITTSSKRNSHTATHTVAETNIASTGNSKNGDLVILIEEPPIHMIKKNHANDHKSQTQHPIAIPNHDHATTPKTLNKSKKRSVSTTTIISKTKASKTATAATQAKSAHKPVKREAKKKGAGKIVKKRKVSVNEEEEKEVENIDDYDKLNDSDNDERLKLEIEELQKTLQTCTARLSMLLEQKSESLNKKLPNKKSNVIHSSTTHNSTSVASKGRRKASTTTSTTNRKAPRNQKNHKAATTKTAKSKRGGNRTYEEEEIYPDYNVEEDIDEIEEEEEEVEEVPESPVFYESYPSAKSTKKRGKKRKAATTTTKTSRKVHKRGSKRGNANNGKNNYEVDYIPKTSVSFSIPSLNMDQKREISDCINKLPPEKMCEVVQIIQESIPLETGQEEIELDIESFDNATLWKLYQFVKDDEKKPRKKNIRKRMKNEVMDQSDSSNILSDSDSDDSSNSSEES